MFVCDGCPFTHIVLFVFMAAMQSSSEQKLTSANSEEPPSASIQQETIPAGSELSSTAPIPQQPPPVPPLPGFDIRILYSFYFVVTSAFYVTLAQ